MASKGAAQDEKDAISSNSSGKEHVEKLDAEKTATANNMYNIDPSDTTNLNAVFENPLAGIPRDQLFADVDEFCQKFGLTDKTELIKKGALISQAPSSALDLEELTPEEKEVLSREHSHKWSQPWRLYWLCTMCSLAAAVQGMDESVNNGAQALYIKVSPRYL